MDDKMVITASTVSKWISILVLVALPASWIIASVRDGELIPTVIKERWWAFGAIFVISAVSLIKSAKSKKTQEGNIK